MQSGFGVKFLFWSGEFEENRRRISQRILMANFDSDFFGLVFPWFQATQKIHAQNSRPELSAFLSNFTFFEPKIYSRRFSAYGEDQQILLSLGLESTLHFWGFIGTWVRAWTWVRARNQAALSYDPIFLLVSGTFDRTTNCSPPSESLSYHPIILLVRGAF